MGEAVQAEAQVAVVVVAVVTATEVMEEAQEVRKEVGKERGEGTAREEVTAKRGARGLEAGVKVGAMGREAESGMVGEYLDLVGAEGWEVGVMGWEVAADGEAAVGWEAVLRGWAGVVG
mmetsp:Transcript_26320/g.78178  ORF Transcript_26320/g.78178 Transcript_26320/m.78178 type:complete len:119 (-) Transcript_26320:2798-3154(-)